MVVLELYTYNVGTKVDLILLSNGVAHCMNQILQVKRQCKCNCHRHRSLTKHLHALQMPDIGEIIYFILC